MPSYSCILCFQPAVFFSRDSLACLSYWCGKHAPVWGTRIGASEGDLHRSAVESVEAFSVFKASKGE